MRLPIGVVPKNTHRYRDITRPRRWAGVKVWTTLLDMAL
jgi:hypothetical protein